MKSTRQLGRGQPIPDKIFMVMSRPESKVYDIGY